MAAAEPSTLEAAFTAQAHRTDAGITLSSSVNPVGNGMPMAKPSGLMSATVISTFKANGSHTPPSQIGVTISASSTFSAATIISTVRSLAGLPCTRRLLAKLPQPLESSMEKMMTVRA